MPDRDKAVILKRSKTTDLARLRQAIIQKIKRIKNYVY